LDNLLHLFSEVLLLPVRLIAALASKDLEALLALYRNWTFYSNGHVFATETSRHLAQAGKQRLSISRFSAKPQPAY
jgi:hypothetical protein